MPGPPSLSKHLHIDHAKLVQHGLKVLGLLWRAIAFGLLLEDLQHVDQVLGLREIFLRLSADWIRHEPQAHGVLKGERTGQVGEVCWRKLDLGRLTGRLCWLCASSLRLLGSRTFAGGLALALDLALPVFVDNDLLFRILAHDGTCGMANRCRTAAPTNPANSGCGRVGCDLNSGWYWTATNQGCEATSTTSTSVPSGLTPTGHIPWASNCSR